MSVLTSSALDAANTTRNDEDARTRRIVLQTADRMAQDTLSSLSRNPDECSLVAGLAANASIFGLREELSLAVASCVNAESGSSRKFLTCLKEVFGEYREPAEF